MERALDRKAEIDHKLALLNKQIRSAQRCDARQCTIPSKMWRIVTAIFVLTHPCVEPASCYLEQKWRHWDSQKDNLCNRLNAWYAVLHATSTVASVLQPKTSAGKDALKKAKSFLQEQHLHDWVDNANRAQGIAPISRLLLEQATRQQPALNREPLLPLGMNQKSKLQWLRRWRRRWRIGLGALQARDTLPPEECQRKVTGQKTKHRQENLNAHFFCHWQTRSPKRGPYNGPIWGAFF